MKYYIYKLVDPEHNIIGYIGETSDPDTRRATHLHESSTPEKNMPRLEFPVMSSSANWKHWLGAMGITPLFVIVDEVEGSHRDSLLLERKHIADYSKRGYRLSNNNPITKSLPCPYSKIWLDVWVRYQTLLPQHRTAEDRFPALVRLNKIFEYRKKILRLIERRLFEMHHKATRYYIKMAVEADQADVKSSNRKAIEMFRQERNQAKTIYMPAPLRKAS